MIKTNCMASVIHLESCHLIWILASVLDMFESAKRSWCLGWEFPPSMIWVRENPIGIWQGKNLIINIHPLVKTLRWIKETEFQQTDYFSCVDYKLSQTKQTFQSLNTIISSANSAIITEHRFLRLSYRLYAYLSACLVCDIIEGGMGLTPELAL